MRWEQFTVRAQEVIEHAIELGQTAKHSTVENGHLVLSLLERDEAITPYLLQKAGISAPSLKQQVSAWLQRQATLQGGTGSPTLGPSLQETLNKALQHASRLKDQYVGIDHLWLALSEAKDDIGHLLRQQGLTKDTIEKAMQAIRKGQTLSDPNAEERFNALSKYAVDLTALARQGKLDPVIGRDEEIRRTLQILARRTKNNPVLIGHPGVGKTAIVEGIAQRIASGDVPETLKNKRLFALDMAALLAGAMVPGPIRRAPQSRRQRINRVRGRNHPLYR